MKPYYAPGGLSAVFYNLVTGADARLSGDVEVYAGLAPPPPCAVLELGVGTGRIALDFARRGYDVTGIDLSEPMLAQAEAARAVLPADRAARIRLLKGDITDPPVDGRYGFAICAFFTLSHLPIDMGWPAFFAAAAERLAPGGVLAVHLPRLSTMRMAGGPVPDGPVFIKPLGAGQRLVLHLRERGFHDDPGHLFQVLEYLVQDMTGKVLASSLERLTYWMADPTPYAAAAGLSPHQPPIGVGEVGDIWSFRKP